MLRFGLAVYGRATPSASRQLPREGAGYYETHVVGKSPRPIEASLRCASRIWLRGVRVSLGAVRPMATPSALAVSATTAGSTRPTRPPRGSLGSYRRDSAYGQ